MDEKRFVKIFTIGQYTPAINLSLIVHAPLCIHKYCMRSRTMFQLLEIERCYSFLFKPGLRFLAFRRYMISMDVGAHQRRMMSYHLETKARLRSVQTITNSFFWFVDIWCLHPRWSWSKYWGVDSGWCFWSRLSKVTTVPFRVPLSASCLMLFTSMSSRWFWSTSTRGICCNLHANQAKGDRHFGG